MGSPQGTYSGFFGTTSKEVIDPNQLLVEILDRCGKAEVYNIAAIEACYLFERLHQWITRDGGDLPHPWTDQERFGIEQ